MPDPTAPAAAPLLTLRPDARALAFGLWAWLAIGIAAGLFGLAGPSATAVRIALGVLGGTAILLCLRAAVRILVRRAEKITLSDKRLEIEYGLLGKRFESIELWRVKDVVLEQSVVDRLFSVGHLTVFSSDQVEPLLRLGPLRDSKVLFDRLRDLSLEARKTARVLQTSN